MLFISEFDFKNFFARTHQNLMTMSYRFSLILSDSLKGWVSELVKVQTGPY
jgi:hypothetical protein